VKIQDCSYDAIILDLELKSGEGIDVCKFMQMKQIETPLIIYTGRALTEEQESEIGKYTDSIIIKTAASDDRLLDEVTLFLHKLKKKDPKSHYLISKTNKQQALTLKGRKILIVDDDPRNIFVLASALEDFGAEIVEAENGNSTLKLLEQQKVDLILIDIMMPVMDGYKVIKKIRESKVYGNIPIIAVTAKSLKDDREKCIAAGANDYISKPVDYDTLVRLVKAWISK
jgi:CheY-like chemotaxis protein